MLWHAYLFCLTATSEPLVWVASKHVGHCSLRKQRVWEEAGTGYWTELSQSPARLDPLRFWHGDQRQKFPVIQRVASILWHQRCLAGSWVCLGLKTILKHLVLGMIGWKVLLLLTFVESVFVSILMIPFPGKMIDIGSSACVVESVTQGQCMQVAARVAPTE